jgi:hypothetical protein
VRGRAHKVSPLLQADPEELPHPRGQIEGGNAAGHVEQFQSEERITWPMMTQTRNASGEASAPQSI